MSEKFGLPWKLLLKFESTPHICGTDSTSNHHR